jgi:cytoskeleton-associated protein 5
MKQVCHIYPASKLFQYLVDYGLKSKNSRTRAECLEEIGHLIQKNGQRVCQMSKVLPIIASHVAGRDASVRNGAISALTQAYLLVGEDLLFKYIGTKMMEKDKDLLLEKLKRIKPNPVVTTALPSAPSQRSEKSSTDSSLVDMSQPLSAPSSASSLRMDVGVPHLESTSQEKRDFSLDIDQLNLPKLSNYAHSSIPQLAPTDLPPTMVAPTPVMPHRGRDYLDGENASDYQLELLINQITGPAAQSIEALLHLEGILQSSPERLKPYINQTVSALTLQFRVALGNSQSSLTTRLCKHLINALAQTFSTETLPSLLSRQTVKQLCWELFNKLVSPNGFDGDFGPQLTRAINVLMVKVLEASKQNTSYG